MNRNLFFTTDLDAAIIQSEIIFVSVNTPTKKYGIGAGRAADLKNWELAARRIAAVANVSVSAKTVIIFFFFQTRGYPKTGFA